MAELYSWFLNAARLGWKLLDAVVIASTRWIAYPAQLVYNAAVAAYSSFATGNYMQLNPAKTLQEIMMRYGGQLPVFGKDYAELELVDMFGGLIEGPFSARGISIGGGNLTGQYHTIDVPAKLSSNFEDIQGLIDKVIATLVSLEQRGHDKFRLQFVVGNPIVLPMQ